MKLQILKTQIIPLILTAVIAALFIVLIRFEIGIINRYTGTTLVTALRWTDIIVGLTIYLKTSIDFAIFIARLMHDNSGWKNRVAIELGTAGGNALGTMAILLLWTLFHQSKWLLALMILIAALVLFRLAEEGLEHVSKEFLEGHKGIKNFTYYFATFLSYINYAVNPVLKYLVPEVGLTGGARSGFLSLLGFSFVVPFILGLDDFAGYVPLFTIVNVFGFSVGVIVGHMILNASLFLSPSHTIKVIKNPIISLLGSIVFAGLAVWGIREALHLLIH